VNTHQLTLDAEIRFRFGVMIYCAIAATPDVDLSQSVFFFA
jgi:hypothetical protein